LQNNNHHSENRYAPYPVVNYDPWDFVYSHLVVMVKWDVYISIPTR